MKKKSYSQASKTNFRRLRQMKAADVKEITRAIVRKGLKPVPPKTPFGVPPGPGCPPSNPGS